MEQKKLIISVSRSLAARQISLIKLIYAFKASTLVEIFFLQIRRDKLSSGTHAGHVCTLVYPPQHDLFIPFAVETVAQFS